MMMPGQKPRNVVLINLKFLFYIGNSISDDARLVCNLLLELKNLPHTEFVLFVESMEQVKVVLLHCNLDINQFNDCCKICTDPEQEILIVKSYLNNHLLSDRLSHPSERLPTHEQFFIISDTDHSPDPKIYDWASCFFLLQSDPKRVNPENLTEIIREIRKTIDVGLNNDNTTTLESHEQKNSTINYNQEFMQLKYDKKNTIFPLNVIKLIQDFIQYKTLEVHFKQILANILPNNLTVMNQGQMAGFYASLQLGLSQHIPNPPSTATILQSSVLSYIKHLDKVEGNWIKRGFAEIFKQKCNLTYQSILAYIASNWPSQLTTDNLIIMARYKITGDYYDRIASAMISNINIMQAIDQLREKIYKQLAEGNFYPINSAALKAELYEKTKIFIAHSIELLLNKYENSSFSTYNELMRFLSVSEDKKSILNTFSNNDRIYWDRLAIEARVICILYKIKLHFTVQTTNGQIEHYIIDETGKSTLEGNDVNYTTPSVIHIAIMSDARSSYYFTVLPQSFLSRLPSQDIPTPVPQLNLLVQAENSASVDRQSLCNSDHFANASQPDRLIDAVYQAFIDAFLRELNYYLNKLYLSLIASHGDTLRVSSLFIARISRENTKDNSTKEDYHYKYCKPIDRLARQQEMVRLKIFFTSLRQAYTQQLLLILQNNQTPLSALTKCNFEIKSAEKIIESFSIQTPAGFGREQLLQDRIHKPDDMDTLQTKAQKEQYWQRRLEDEFHLSPDELQDLKEKMQSSYDNVYQYCKADKFEQFSAVITSENDPRLGALQFNFILHNNSLTNINFSPRIFRGRYWYTSNLNVMLRQLSIFYWEALWRDTLELNNVYTSVDYLIYITQHKFAKTTSEILALLFQVLQNDVTACEAIEECEAKVDEMTPINPKMLARWQEAIAEDLTGLNHEQIRALIALQHDGLTIDLLRSRPRLLKYSAEALVFLVQKEKIPVLSALDQIQELKSYQRYGLAQELSRDEVLKLRNKQQVDTLVNCKHLGLTAVHFQNLDWFTSQPHEYALLYLLYSDKKMTIEQALNTLAGMNEMQAKCVTQGIACERVADLTELQAETVSLLFDHGLHPEHLRGKNWFSNPYHRDVLIYLITKKMFSINDALKVIDGTSWIQILDIVKSLCRPDLKITPELLRSPVAFWHRSPAIAATPTAAITETVRESTRVDNSEQSGASNTNCQL